MNGTSDASQRGVVIVESALTFIVFFVLLFGIVEAGRFMHVQQTLTDAAREGARLAVAPNSFHVANPGAMPTESEIQAEVQRFLNAARIPVPDESIVIQTVNCTTGAAISCAPGTVPAGTVCCTRVTVTYPYQVMTLAIFTSLQINLRGRAEMRNETSP